MDSIKGFDGDYECFSNFYPVENLTIRGIKYPTSEHAFQAMKTEDEELRKQIAEIETPGKAKRFGKKISLSEYWEERKVSIMFYILLVKFSGNTHLAYKLYDTRGTYLEENNDWNDTFWGVCNGEGSNMLGHVLMATRSMLTVSPESWWEDVFDEHFCMLECTSCLKNFRGSKRIYCKNCKGRK